MKFKIGLAYVNRPDLLLTAANSIRPFWRETILIDNSEQRELVTHPFFAANFRVIAPIVPLTFSQSMNLLQTVGMDEKCDVILFMHNDAEAAPGSAEQLLAMAEQLIADGKRWGAIFTHYDVFVAFSMEAVRNVGRWDTNLPQYFADNDYYRRLRLAGYPTIDSGLPVTHHNASSTIRSDPLREHINGITFPLYAKYYEAKWGGGPGNEQFSVPFNRQF
ncbi:MAG TPA: glycosyltransferase family 2 protein [Bacilli bacterium]